MLGDDRLGTELGGLDFIGQRPMQIARLSVGSIARCQYSTQPSAWTSRVVPLGHPVLDVGLPLVEELALGMLVTRLDVSPVARIHPVVTEDPVGLVPVVQRLLGRRV